MVAFFIGASCFTLIHFRKLAGFRNSFFEVADQDTTLVLNALAINADGPQTYRDHPGVLTILGLSEWFKITHKFGINRITTATQLEGVAQFTPYFNELAFSARLFSLLCCAIFLAVFFACCYTITSNLLLSAAVTYGLSCGQGMFIQSMMIRTEMLCILFIALALTFLLKAVRKNEPVRFLWYAASGFCMYLAMINKIQAGPIFLLFPVLALPFLPRVPGAELRFSDFSGISAKSKIAVTIFSLSAVASLTQFFSSLKGFSYSPNQMTLWAVLGVIALTTLFSVLYMQRTLLECLEICFFSLVGFSFASQVPFLNLNPENHRMVLFFLDEMGRFCTSGDCGAKGLKAALLGSLWVPPLSPFADKFHWSFLMSVPSGFFYWVLVPSGLVLLLKGRTRIGIQVVVLLGVCLVLEAFFKHRYTRLDSPTYVCYYAIFIEMFLGLATLIVCQDYFGFLNQKKIHAILFLFLTWSVGSAWSYVNWDKYARDSFMGLSVHQDPENFCHYLDYSTQVKSILLKRGDCRKQIEAEIASLPRNTKP